MLIAEARRTRRKDVSALYLCLGLPKGVKIPRGKSLAKIEASASIS
jgi:hypothetical protein